MKSSDVIIGNYFFDGKAGLREVLSVEGPRSVVRYRILSAKVEREMQPDGSYKSIIGDTSECLLGSFMGWAKISLAPVFGEPLLQELRAAKIKLSGPEQAFMESVATEAPEARIGTLVSFDPDEKRAVGGLERKGLLKRLAGGEIELLESGAARVRAVNRARGN
ncbi:hypothetical protein ABIC83_002471 [Roseateles asaccharophilus]|uniref:hypothetical protein n=1 Tax=Roseateles asaccharophilus TaxID=582607 RepID=UPI0038371362